MNAGMNIKDIQKQVRSKIDEKLRKCLRVAGEIKMLAGIIWRLL